MPQPNLPMLLKRMATTQMAIANEIANPNLVNDIRRAALLEESRAIVADLQALTDRYIIPTVARGKVGQ